MTLQNRSCLLVAIVLLTVGLADCRHGTDVKEPVLFEALEKDRTGLDFSNILTPTQDFNVFKYMYYFNGGGAGAGDFNNDGKIDLFFAGNQVSNRMYLNQGGLKFKDISDPAKIPRDSAWSTGVSVVDINDDGLLDIYVCRVGKLESLHSQNQLLICQGIGADGIPTYKDEAKEYGLDFSGFSSQALFFDYDRDGDLDMYLLNHSVHQNGTFGPRKDRLAATNPLSGDRLYRNDGEHHFTDVTKVSGIHSSVIGYGLGIGAADINLDGWPDLYIGNDFHENDYLYINQKNGRFADSLEDQVMHTSQFTMGVDIGDINNDGFPDVVSMDMLPSDPYILKRSEGEDDYETFYMKIRYGYNFQYTRNNLQLNRRNGQFSEIGLYSGVYASDWSWSPLFVDFDNDGSRDLFISNGIPKRLNDIDYIHFISNIDLQEKMKDNGLDQNDLKQIDRFPQIKIPDKFFRNSPDLRFDDMADHIKNAKETFSNGAIYADLDNDGDLDIVTNNIEDPVLLYENKSNDLKDHAFEKIKLMGPAGNRNATGARIVIFADSGLRTYEKQAVHGFLSSEEIPLHIGLYKTKVDSAFLIWPDNTFQPVILKAQDSVVSVRYQKGLPVFNFDLIRNFRKNVTRPVSDVTGETGLKYLHHENSFPEFEREPLIPRMMSTEGPALSVADFNHDGLDDVFVGAARYGKAVVFLQQSGGKFLRSPQPVMESDSSLENVASCVADINHDGAPDLVVANGGNEFYGNDPHLTPRIFINDGHGNFSALPAAFDSLFVNASSVVSTDFNHDGFPDLFIGGRSVPFKYGEIPRSYLLMNNRRGKFVDVTDKLAPGLKNVGFVTSAQWFDLDKNGKNDLLLTLEWGGIIEFVDKGDRFEKQVLSDKKGWWNFLLPADLDGDGRIDLVAGNLGLNSRLKASAGEPVRLYYGDFDDNGKKDQVLSYFLNGRELPFANEAELQKQMPALKKKFLYAEDFAKAGFNDLFPKDKLAEAQVYSADYFSSAILMNRGAGGFEVKAMPWEAQLSPLKTASIVDANGDGLPDVFLAGNYYDNNIQMGRSDADYGTLLINEGKGSFLASTLNGLSIRGQVRHMEKLMAGGKESLVLAKNNDSLEVIRFH